MATDTDGREIRTTVATHRRRQSAMTDNRSGEASSEPSRLGGHVLYKTSDLDALAIIKDRNGEVVLGLCRNCSRGEVELAIPCDAIAHTHSAASVSLTDDQLDCAVCGELRVRAEPVRHGVSSVDSLVSREATGRLGEPFMASLWSVPHSDHRYSTVGDWQFREAPAGCTRIDVQVSATPDWRHAALIAVHELIEAILCRHRGISQDEVDSFDLAHPELVEPGASENCPYRREHLHAHHVEVNLAYELGVDWQEYTAALDALDE